MRPDFLALEFGDLGVHQNDRDISRNKGSSTQSSYTPLTIPYVYSSRFRNPDSEYMWVIDTYTYIHIHMLICVYTYKQNLSKQVYTGVYVYIYIYMSMYGVFQYSNPIRGLHMTQKLPLPGTI